MTKINLDLKDRKILYQLDLNARQPIGQIAKKVGLSKEVVNYRIRRLENEGVIKSYYTIIDMSRLGYFSFRIYLKLLEATPSIEKEILNYLIKDKNSFFVAEVDGPFDIALGVWVTDVYEFEDFYLKFKKEFKKYLGKEQISIFTIAYHFHRYYILEKKQSESKVEYFGKSQPEKHDELDMKILKLLSKDARIALTKLSKELNTPESTLAFRIKRLEKKGIIQGYRALFNLDSLGYEYFKVDLILKDTSKIKELVAYANSNSHIVYIDQTIGGSDFEFDVEVENKKQLLEIINEFRTRFPEIREWTYFALRKYDKLLYFPETI